MASTKFGSEAYAEGDPEKEARIIRTAAAIALASSLPVAVLLMIFAGTITGLFNVPEHLAANATVALRIAAIGMVINFLCGIFNTPQLARLRMDLNTLITAIPRILGQIATPIAIYLGYGITGAMSALLAASVLTLAGHLIISRRLLPALIAPGLAVEATKPLLRYGGPVLLTLIAASLLINLEKVVLARVASVKELAYYSVAFNFAGMITMFSQSMLPTLMPAFARLTAPERRNELYTLYLRTIRLNIAVILPLFVILATVAKPLFTVWAGSEFGLNSTIPFYILLIGYFLNLMAYVSQALLLAAGRTSIIAKLNWVELIFYIVLLFVLSSRFGAIGAASAWAARVGVDCFIVIYFGRKFEGAPIRAAEWVRQIGISSALLAPVLTWSVIFGLSFSIIAVLAASLLAYSYFVWFWVLEPSEREHIKVLLGINSKRVFG
jgi:O-antigen/teichoic acid export membrane protein